MIDFDPQERAFLEYIKEDIPDIDDQFFQDIYRYILTLDVYCTDDNPPIARHIHLREFG